MSRTLRNLVLLGLIVVMINSALISHHSYHQRNMHRIRIQQVAHKQETDNTEESSIADTLQSIVDTISASIEPDTPAIIETKNLPVLVFSKDSCQSLTEDQKTSILDKVKTTKDSVTAFKAELKDDNVSDDADSSITYLNIIEQLVNKNCDDINKNILIGPTPYQTNIVTDQPWIFGGLTLDDITKDYIQRINKYDNVTNCGSSTPFWDGTNCLTCADQTPVFNIDSGKCEVCPQGKAYDADTHSCIDEEKYKPNSAAKPHALVPSDAEEGALDKYMNTGDKECPEESPFVQKNKCVPCPEDTPYFNIVSAECVSCSQFQEETNKCNQPPNGTDVPTYTPKLVMNGDSTNDDWDKYVKENENKVFCKSDAPFWNGTECIQCPDLFNIITKQCMDCQLGSGFHSSSHKCEPLQPLEPSILDLFNVLF